MTRLRRERGYSLTLNKELAAGGEGKIYTLYEEPYLVAKLYHPDKLTPEHGLKLQVMLNYPPLDTARQQGCISIAWPTERLFDVQGRFVGFLMPYVDHSFSFPLLKLYNPQDRRQTLSRFTWQYLLHTASNLASVLAALHASGYVIGDLNESNVLVNGSALVTLVDCDSIQVPRGNGQVYRCPVGKPEYTPPELQGRDFSQVDRAVYHDQFGLAVLIFLLLMEGLHPFAGVWQGVGMPPTQEQNIQAGNCPCTGSRLLTPPPRALPFNTLPPALQRLMVQCFAEGHRYPQRRPTALEWLRALSSAEQYLTFCRVNSQHCYSRHLSACPWCERIRWGIPDPFPPLFQQTVIRQTPLSPIYPTSASRNQTTTLSPGRRSYSASLSAPLGGIRSQAKTFPAANPPSTNYTSPSFYVPPSSTYPNTRVNHPLTQGKQKVKLPSHLPLIQGKLKKNDAVYIVGYSTVCLLCTAPAFFYSALPAPILFFAGLLFLLVTPSGILLAGPVLGSWRGLLAVITYFVQCGLVLSVQALLSPSSHSSPGANQTSPWQITLLLAGILIAVLVTGLLYEGRRTHSWLMTGLTMFSGSIVLIMSFWVSSSNPWNAGGIVSVLVGAAILALPATLFETVILRILASVKKKGYVV